ncbi:MAG: hypothetical protein JW884_03145 [Deltaproteobacteria bacterium]|nr:hypothetical protein [Deltaproteobacteria bacterium]
MTVRIAISPDTIDAITGDTLVAGLFSDERPPRGFCGDIDWRLNSLLSRLMAEKRIKGSFREATLITPMKRLYVEKVLIVGLGPIRSLTYKRIHQAGETIAGILRGILSEHAVIAVPGTGRSSLEIATMTRSFITGLCMRLMKIAGGDRAFTLLGRPPEIDELILGLQECKVALRDQIAIDIEDSKGA